MRPVVADKTRARFFLAPSMAIGIPPPVSVDHPLVWRREGDGEWRSLDGLIPFDSRCSSYSCRQGSQEKNKSTENRT